MFIHYFTLVLSDFKGSLCLKNMVGSTLFTPNISWYSRLNMEDTKNVEQDTKNLQLIMGNLVQQQWCSLRTQVVLKCIPFKTDELITF